MEGKHRKVGKELVGRLRELATARYAPTPAAVLYIANVERNTARAPAALAAVAAAIYGGGVGRRGKGG